MSTKSRFRGGNLEFFDGQTHERTAPAGYPVVFYDDFIGANTVIPAAGSSESGMEWVKKIVGAAPPTAARMADTTPGWIACTLTSASQKQEAAIYHDDNRGFDVTKGLVFEARVKLSTLPTLLSVAHIGLIHDWADNVDSSGHLLFQARGSGEYFVDVDDGTSPVFDTTSGVTATTAQSKIFRIDCTDVANIAFYIDGVAVATSTTFAFNATGDSAIVQPYIGMYKPSGAGVGTLEVDFVRIFQDRS